ncbi:MAG: chemotaxis protein CheC [Candidatus Nanoarchaeia archaeon]
MDNQYDVKDMELDAIKEVGNIGAGNAAVSLSKILNKKIEMDVPEADFIPLNNFAEKFGGPERIVMSIYSPIVGELTGETLFIFSRDCAMGLVDLMMGNEIGHTKIMDELSESAFKEMANIFIGSYLNAISDMINLKIMPGVPVVATDMVQAILDSLLMRMGEYADKVLCNKAKISIEGHPIKGDFIFIFDLETMKVLLNKMHNSYNSELDKS